MPWFVTDKSAVMPASRLEVVQLHGMDGGQVVAVFLADLCDRRFR
jgi:hypothetical protein